MIFSLARSRSAAFFDSHSFVLGRAIYFRAYQNEPDFFLRGCFFLVFARDDEPPM